MDFLSEQEKKAEKGPKVCIIHGTSDNICEYPGAEKARDILAGAGWEVELLSFDGRHTINPEQILSAFVSLGRANPKEEPKPDEPKQDRTSGEEGAGE